MSEAEAELLVAALVAVSRTVLTPVLAAELAGLSLGMAACKFTVRTSAASPPKYGVSYGLAFTSSLGQKCTVSLSAIDDGSAEVAPGAPPDGAGGADFEAAALPEADPVANLLLSAAISASRLAICDTKRALS